jgi:CRISPR-associated protein Cas6
MFWEEDEDKTLPFTVPDDIIDISFALKCKQLHIDHAWELSQAIQEILPWIETEENFGIHQIHVAESGNGWLRPEDTENEVLWPSHRTRLFLRVPKERIPDVKKLTGSTLNIKGNEIILGKSRKKELNNASVIFARYILSNEDENEDAFLGRIQKEIQKVAGITCRKMMCGKSNIIRTPEGNLQTRHLMIADLDSDPSIKLQQYGIGKGRKLGCGIFLPHKGIKTLKPTE